MTLRGERPLISLRPLEVVPAGFLPTQIEVWLIGEHAEGIVWESNRLSGSSYGKHAAPPRGNYSC